MRAWPVVAACLLGCQSEPPTRVKLETAQVVVAARALAPGDVLDPSSLAIVELPLGAFPLERFADPDALGPRIVARAVRFGEVLQAGHLLPRADRRGPRIPPPRPPPGPNGMDSLAPWKDKLPESAR